MSLFLRPALSKGRVALLRSLNWATPCLSKRLGSPGSFLELNISGRFARATSTIPAAAQTHAEGESPPEDSPVPLRELRVGTPVSGVKFEEQEGKYYHGVMEALPMYQDTVFLRRDLDALKSDTIAPEVSEIVKRQDWSEASSDEIVKAFHILTSYAVKKGLVISDPQFDHICIAIKNQINNFTDDELLEVGKLHTIWPFPESVKARNYKVLNESFDLACCSRYQKEWHTSRNMTKILQAADVFYWQRVGGKSHYLRCMVYHLGMKTKESHHLIQIMFSLGLLSSVPGSYKFYDLERKVFSFREHYSVQELAIVVNSLFRTKSRMQYYPLMQDLLIKSLKNFSILDDYLLVTVSKGFNNAPTELKPLLVLFQNRLLARIDDFKMEALIHALWMFASNGVVNDDFAQAIYERSLKNISKFRSKELTRIMTVFTEYISPNRDLKKLAECVFQELQNTVKKMWFRRLSFVQGATLHRLLMCGVCPTEFLDEYLKSITKSELANEALGVDVHLEVFYPDYKGARLNSHVREAVFKNRFQSKTDTFVKSCGTTGKRSTFNRHAIESAEGILLDVLDGRKDCMLIKQVVPSSGYQAVILRIGKDGRYLPIPTQMVQLEPWELTKIPLENNEDKFVAITFIATSSEFKNKNLTWLQREKDAILRKLGYIPIDVGMEHWWNNSNFTYKKTDLLKRIAAALSE